MYVHINYMALICGTTHTCTLQGLQEWSSKANVSFSNLTPTTGIYNAKLPPMRQSCRIKMWLKVFFYNMVFLFGRWNLDHSVPDLNKKCWLDLECIVLAPSLTSSSHSTEEMILLYTHTHTLTRVQQEFPIKIPVCNSINRWDQSAGALVLPSHKCISRQDRPTSVFLNTFWV